MLAKLASTVVKSLSLMLLAEHRPHRRVAGRADRVGGDALAFDVLDGFYRPIRRHDIILAVISGDAVRHDIGHYPLVEMGVADGKG
jgi:hypothetical protein